MNSTVTFVVTKTADPKLTCIVCCQTLCDGELHMHSNSSRLVFGFHERCGIRPAKVFDEETQNLLDKIQMLETSIKYIKEVRDEALTERDFVQKELTNERQRCATIVRLQPFAEGTHTGTKQRWVKQQIEQKIRCGFVPPEWTDGTNSFFQGLAAAEQASKLEEMCQAASEAIISRDDTKLRVAQMSGDELRECAKEGHDLAQELKKRTDKMSARIIPDPPHLYELIAAGEELREALENAYNCLKPEAEDEQEVAIMTALQGWLHALHGDQCKGEK